jgi:hypothetical protein
MIVYVLVEHVFHTYDNYETSKIINVYESEIDAATDEEALSNNNVRSYWYEIIEKEIKMKS